MLFLNKKQSLIGLTSSQMAKRLASFNQPEYRAEQIYKWVHHHQVPSFEEMSNIPKSFRRELEQHFIIGTLEMAGRKVSIDGTIKYLWQLPDAKRIESVFIPESTRTTLCISSQVGCALGCHFCATARMGFLRNLTAGEIVEQVIRIRRDTGRQITNMVFMGMGEPFLNYNRVIRASKILADPQGLAISAKKITISTVGVVPRILQFTEEKQPFSLAISLHAASQTLRRQIMPIAKKFPLDEIMESAHNYTQAHQRKRITFEYVLMAGVNDSPNQARALIKLLSPLRCKLNLIPYNNTGLGFTKPQESRQQQFLSEMQSAPFAVTLRKNRGNDIEAACGQLMVKSSENEKARYLKSSPLKKGVET